MLERNTPAKIIAYCGMLTALAMIFSYVESLIPISFGVPGIKLGLANLVVLNGLYILRPREVLAVSVSRILLMGFLFGSGMSILYSLGGGLLSFAVMVLLLRTKLFSRIGVSVAGAVAHNAGQLLVAALVLRSGALIAYAPALLISGAVTGGAIGLLSEMVTKAVGKTNENGSV